MRRLLVGVVWLVSALGLCAQERNDAAFYLLDSIQPEALSPATRTQLDAALQTYHSSTSDTQRVAILNRALDALPFVGTKLPYGRWLFAQEVAALNKPGQPAAVQHFYQRQASATLNHILTTHYVLDNMEAAEHWMRLRLQRCRAWQLQPDVADSYTDVGIAHFQFGRHDSAVWYLRKALTIYDTIPYVGTHGNCLATLAQVHKVRGNYPLAIEMHKRGLMLREQAGDSTELGHSYSGLAQLYFEQGEHVLAIEYWQRAIRQYKAFGAAKATLTAGALNALANAHLTTGDTAKAVACNREALSLSKAHGLRRMKVRALVDLADIYRQQGKLPQAAELIAEALPLADTLNLPAVSARALLQSARLQQARSNNTAATAQAQESMQLARESEDVRLQQQAAALLSSLYAQAKRWQDAFQMQEKAALLRDSIANDENRQAAIRQQVEYEFDKAQALSELAHQTELAEQEAEQARQRAIIAATVAGALVLLALLAFIVNRLQLVRKQKSVIEEQAARLEALDASKTRFFNNVAHELRTPLTLMTGHLESMLSERFGGLNERQRKSISVAKNNTHRLLELVTEILDLGRLESGRMALNAQPVRAKLLADRLLYTFEALADQLDIAFALDYQLAEDCTLLLDVPKMEKVLNNLLHNALKFTPRGGSVTLSALQTETGIQFLVADTGPGIPPDDCERVFDRYFQSSGKHTTSQGGTGIGLAVVRELTELHGGTATVQSALGQGTTFAIALPASRLTDPAAAVAPAQEALKLELPEFPLMEGKAATVLVVEDNKEMQHYLAEILSEHARVIVAGDGVEALQRLETNKVDLLTIDVMMPNMDGFELLRQLRANEAHRNVPAIMLTARASEADKLQALTIGVNDYVTKPFAQQELLVRVANLLQNYQVREQARAEEGTAEPAAPTQSTEHDFIDALRAIVLQQLDNSEFSVRHLAQEIGLSEKQLTRNVKKATGLTPLKFIRELKLRHAQEGLRAKSFDSVAAAAYAIGIENPSYFTKLFTERFGKNPSEYLV